MNGSTQRIWIDAMQLNSYQLIKTTVIDGDNFVDLAMVNGKAKVIHNVKKPGTKNEYDGQFIDLGFEELVQKLLEPASQNM